MASATALYIATMAHVAAVGPPLGRCDSHRWKMRCKDQGLTSTLMGFWLLGTGLSARQGWMSGFLYPGPWGMYANMLWMYLNGFGHAQR